MISFPNSKINIGLQILNKRADGFHNLQSIFYPVQKKDVLEILPKPNLQTDLFTVLGNVVDGDIQSNLCYQAIQLLRNDFPDKIKFVESCLLKNIPSGGGLGGGSSDGTFMLSMLNDLYQLGLSPAKLATYALQLGSDCPFFVYNTAAFVSGRGEFVEPLKLSLSGYHLILVNPGIHVTTGAAFSSLKLENRERFDLKKLSNLPIEVWKNFVENDFETSVFELHPEIKNIKNKLYQSGAIYAQMSGTGSSVYGIFSDKKEFSFPKHYLVNHFLL